MYTHAYIHTYIHTHICICMYIVDIMMRPLQYFSRWLVHPRLIPSNRAPRNHKIVRMLQYIQVPRLQARAFQKLLLIEILHDLLYTPLQEILKFWYARLRTWFLGYMCLCSGLGPHYSLCQVTKKSAQAAESVVFPALSQLRL